MCKHCERLVEDIEHKQLVHDFMVVAASGVNRKLREDKIPIIRDVTADDLELDIRVIAPTMNPNGIAYHPAVLRLVYRDLLEAVE